MRRVPVFLVLVCCFYKTAVSRRTSYTQPQQVHLSFGASDDQRVVTWVTFDRTSRSTVEFGPYAPVSQAFGNVTKVYVGKGRKRRSLYVHRVVLDRLVPGTLYRYHCGSSDGWSSMFMFKVPQREGDFYTLAVYGDLGNARARSLATLQSDVHRGQITAVLHLGDIAYNLESDNGHVGDEFMRQIEPIAAFVPYMTAVGNHEAAKNFTSYTNRFSMMDKNGSVNNFFYSFNVGPAHIISYSSEYYFFLQYGWRQVTRQYRWLEKDLQEANLPENRKKRPWIITMSHRPMYCSNVGVRDCNLANSIIRKGLPLTKMFGLEDLFHRYGVDLQFTGHQHSYERLWPVYDNQVLNGTGSDPYTNPKASVHVVSGAAGNSEDLAKFVKDPKPWSAVRISEYGYTRLKLLNNTHLQLEQISTQGETPNVVDFVTIVKDTPWPERVKVGNGEAKQQ